VKKLKNIEFKIINNEVWTKNCMRCNIPLKRNKNERILCWSCWEEIHGRNKEEKDVGLVPQTLINPTPQEQVSYDGPAYKVTFSRIEKGIKKGVVIYCKLTGNMFLVPNLPEDAEKHLIAVIREIPIHDSFPTHSRDYFGVSDWLN